MPHPPNIPLTRQTDDRNFPQHDPAAPWGQSGHAYPKRMNREFMPEDVEPWKKQHVQYDAQSRSEYYYDRCPQPQRVMTSGKVVKGQLVPVIVTQEMIDCLQLTQSVGEELVVNNAEEETKARGFLGQVEEEITPASVTALVQKDKTEAELERMKRQNAELEAELERHVQLTQKIKAEQEARAAAMKTETAEAPVKKKGGRPKGSRNKVVQSLTDIGRYDVSD